MIIQQKFSQFCQEYDLAHAPIYPVNGGGEVVLNEAKTLALVWSDGRYPALEKGSSFNTLCTEKITVLWGGIVIQVGDLLVSLTEGESIVIKPKTAYSLVGKAVCRVDIDPPWASSQNSFVAESTYSTQI